MKYLYVCDHRNDRVQILTKDKGIYVAHWGNGETSTEKGGLTRPSSIFLDELENIFYVGDKYSVQLFLSDGKCIQRLGEGFDAIFGLCKIDDRLYVSDFERKRIQVFTRN